MAKRIAVLLGGVSSEREISLRTGAAFVKAVKRLGHEAVEDESPTVLDTYANTSSAGSIIAFHKHNQDLKAGDLGLICSFGAGYSAGSVFVRKVA